MKTYDGIPAEKLDALTVRIRYATAANLGICSEADRYWREELRSRTLTLNVRTVCMFEALPVGFSTDSQTLHVNVGGLVNAWCGCVDAFWDELKGDYGDPPEETVRNLKAVLLKRFRPEVYEKLGGKH